MRRPGAAFSALLVAVALTVPPSTLTLAPARAQAGSEGGSLLGLGGNPGLPADAVLPFRAGVAGAIGFEATVQNLGDSRVGLRVTTEGHESIEVAFAEGFIAPLDPGEQRSIPVVLRVGPGLPAGDHPVSFSLTPVSVAGPVVGFSVAPGIGGRAIVRAGGAAARVRIVARDLLEDSAMTTGRVSLYVLSDTTAPLLLEEADAGELDRSVLPGMFRATFERPALDPDAPPVRTATDFALSDGADETVVLSVVGFSVFTLDVEPSFDDDGGVEHADVRITLRNRLEVVRRPLVLELQVRKDGELVEIIELSTLLELPTGVTSSNSRYRPAGGFTSGEWALDVRLGSGWIGIGPDEPARFMVSEGRGAARGGASSMMVVGLLVLGLIGVLVGVLFATGRLGALQEWRDERRAGRRASV